MKAILEFILPEDQDSLANAQNGDKAHAALSEIMQNLRNKIKYHPNNQSDEMLHALEAIREEFWEIINGYNLEV